MKLSLLALCVCSFPQHSVLPFAFVQNGQKQTLKGTERKLDLSPSIVDDYERSKERLDELIRNKDATIVEKKNFDHYPAIMKDYERSKEHLDELIGNVKGTTINPTKGFDHYSTIMKDYERSKEHLDELIGNVEETNIDPNEFSKKQTLDKLMESKQFHQSLTSERIDDYPSENEWFLHDDKEEKDFEPEFGGGVLPNASFDHISLDEIMKTQSFRSSLDSE